MNRKSSSLNAALVVSALVGAMLIIGSACNSRTPIPTTATTPPITLATIALFTPKPSAAPSVPPQSPTSNPAPSVVGRTSAKQLTAQESATQQALPAFDLPGGKFLLVRADETEQACMTNCNCPPARHENWNNLNADQQLKSMQEMIQDGARGFVIKSRNLELSGCACFVHEEWIEPIKRMPFTLAQVILYRVDRDGTVIVYTGDATWAFKPGDSWSHTSTQSPGSLGSVLCKSSTYSTRSTFQNNGFVSIAMPPTRIPSPTSTSTPTATRVPVATWLAQAIPADTEISYTWDDGNGNTGLSVRLLSNGAVSCEKREYGARSIQSGKISLAELERIVLKFAEIDFFAMSSCGHGCVYYATQPRQLATRPPCVALDFNIEQTSITIHGLRHNLWLGRGVCDSPGDPRAQQGLEQLISLLRSVCDKIPETPPTPNR